MVIVVGIPVYDGKLPAETVKCLLDERIVAHGTGDDLQVRLLPGCSHPAMGRNQIAHDFMASEADRLVFLDSDVTFEPGALVKIAHQPVHFAGGAYRYKMDQENYPVGWLDRPELWSDKLGLLEVATLPGGFLSLSRNVFERLRAAHPEREYEHFGKKSFCYFQMPFIDGLLYGEDSFFCKEWRDLGGKVYLDPEITLTHWNGGMPYVGHIGNWLKRRASANEVKQCLPRGI